MTTSENIKLLYFCVIVFAIGSTIFNIVGPKILGKATTELFKGLVEKYPGHGALILTRSEKSC